MNNKIISKIGFNYLIYGIISLILQIIVLNILISSNTIHLIANTDIETIIMAICNYIIPLPIIVYLMSQIDAKTIPKHKINIETFLKYLSITITLMWIGNIIGMLITGGIGILIQNDVSNPVQTLINSSDFLINLCLISIIGPVFEEFFFRKLLIDRTIKYGAGVSIILSATLFGLFHGNLNQVFYASFIGAFLAYVYIKTGKITYTIILHMILNLMGSVISLIVVKSSQTILAGTLNPTDLAIVLIYALIIITALIIGLYSLFKKYIQMKGKIKLPLKTAFINYGMICFIGFFTIIIIRQLLL